MRTLIGWLDGCADEIAYQHGYGADVPRRAYVLLWLVSVLTALYTLRLPLQEGIFTARCYWYAYPLLRLAVACLLVLCLWAILGCSASDAPGYDGGVVGHTMQGTPVAGSK